MHFSTFGFLLTILARVALAKVVCHNPPPPQNDIPSLNDCHEHIEDLFAVSKLEDDERYFWSRDPPTGPGNRKLPYYFNTPTSQNDCQILVDTVKKDDAEDEFSIYDVGLTARDVVRTCLDVKEGEEASIGAEIVGPKRAMVVVLLRKIPEPVMSGRVNGTGSRWQLPLQGSRAVAGLVEDLTS